MARTSEALCPPLVQSDEGPLNCFTWFFFFYILKRLEILLLHRSPEYKSANVTTSSPFNSSRMFSYFHNNILGVFLGTLSLIHWGGVNEGEVVQRFLRIDRT